MILQEWRFVPGAAKVYVLTLMLTTALVATIPESPAQGSPVPGAGGSINATGSGNGYAANGASTSNATNGYGGYNTIPGQASSTGPSSASAPVPGAGRMQSPLASGKGAAQAAGPKNKYRDLPLTVDSAKYRVEELRNLLPVSRPQDMQESVQELCEWLNDAADAHYRMYMSFAKSDLTRAQANSEKQLNQRFGQLKREAQLLRADLLIKQLRAPEALAPLVEIVVADPRSATGREAYKRLVDLGFSQGVPQAAEGGVPAVAPLPHDIKTQANSQPSGPLH